MDAYKIMKKYPRIVAHLITESLGYFTPKSAANAIIRAKTMNLISVSGIQIVLEDMEICGTQKM